MSLYTRLVRPLLFALPPDRAHALASATLRWRQPWALAAPPPADPRLRTTLAGIPLANPVGLAAGFDKNADVLPTLMHLGFGYVSVGSIMPAPRWGNPFPRNVRYPRHQSMADAAGLPSKGLAHAIERLAALPHPPVPVIANVGGLSAADLAAGVLAVEPYASAVEVNLSCPNVQHGPDFDELALLRQFIAGVADRRTKPICLKVPLPLMYDEARMAELVELACAARFELLKVNGGRWVRTRRLGVGRGALHGRATFEDALANVARAVRLARGRLQVKANGGIFSGADALAMLEAGAATVEVYTAFVYEGPWVAAKICRELLALLDARGLHSLADLAPPRVTLTVR